MKKFTPAEINGKTLSRGLTTSNCVYVAKEDTVAIMQGTKEMVNISKGSLFAIEGCGRLSEGDASMFRIGEKWGAIPNNAVEHYANPLMARANE